jgi:hypothetical protein
MKLKLKVIATCAALLMSNLALAQSSKMQNPDILGIRIGMSKTEVMAIIKEKFPKSKLKNVSKEVMIGTADLIYDAQTNISLDITKPTIAEDNLRLSFLPDDTVIAVRRLIRYVPRKQTTADIHTGLKEKFGDLSYFVYDDTTQFEDRTMWSDRMLPGLSLVGTNYVQGNYISPGDFGTVTPYPYCWAEMLTYFMDTYNPKEIYQSLTDRSGVSLNRANKWKSCGKALWVSNLHERSQLNFYATQTEMILMDLSSAPEQMLSMPTMLKNNPKTTYAKPVTELPKPNANTPNF